MTRNQLGKIVISSSSINSEYYQAAIPFLELPMEETYESRDIETLFRTISKSKYVGSIYVGSRVYVFIYAIIYTIYYIQ